MPTLLRSLSARTCQSRKSKLGLKVSKSSVRVSFRSLFTGLLVIFLLLSSQPVSIWASGASAVKEAVDPITARVSSSTTISGISDWVKNPSRNKASKQTFQRAASRLRVKGSKIRMAVGTQQQVTAIAIDNNENPVDGIRFSWASSNPQVAEVDGTGIVKAVSVGFTEIIARGEGLQESFRIHVLQHVDLDRAPDHHYIIPSSTTGQTNRYGGDTKRGYKYRLASYKGGVGASAPNPTYDMLADDPRPSVQTDPDFNVGMPPNAPVSGGGGFGGTSVNPSSSSYNRVFPILDLAGRGEAGTSLSLVYNSQLWTYDVSNSTNPYQYNVNRDWPGPGFHLDFGKLNWKTGTPDEFMFISSDGTRHPMQNIATDVYETTDSTFIRINKISTGHFKTYFPDGTVITYDQPGPDDYYYASRVQDRNGNFITIAYTASTTAQIDYITDTLGRQIQFFYSSPDVNGNTWVTYITAPDYNNGSNSGRREVVRFYYESSAITLSGSFSNGAAKINGADCSSGCGVTYLKRIYYPANGTGFLLTNSGVYGQITKVSQRVSMTTGSDGTEIASTEFNYPSSGPLSDIPKFTQRSESWANADITTPVTYSYATTNDGTYDIYTETDPTGRKTVQKTPMSG